MSACVRRTSAVRRALGWGAVGLILIFGLFAPVQEAKAHAGAAAPHAALIGSPTASAAMDPDVRAPTTGQTSAGDPVAAVLAAPAATGRSCCGEDGATACCLVCTPAILADRPAWPDSGCEPYVEIVKRFPLSNRSDVLHRPPVTPA